jgi:hypothetical protein
VGSEDFKSFCRALITSGVGSIPTRSRQSSGARRGWRRAAAAGVLLAALVVSAAGASETEEEGVAEAATVPGALADSSAAPAPIFADSTAVPTRIVPIDSVDVLFDAADSVAAGGAGRRGDRDGARIRRVQEPPNLALTTIKSGLVPGWGQWTNGKRLKAIAVFGVWGTFATQAVLAEQDRKDAVRVLGDSGDPNLEAEVNDAVERRNSRLWLMGAVSVFAMLDAYVDAHFWNYDEEWSARVAPGPDGLPVLAVRWRF